MDDSLDVFSEEQVMGADEERYFEEDYLGAYEGGAAKRKKAKKVKKSKKKRGRGEIYGGDEAPKNWHLALMCAIIIALVLIYYRENFLIKHDLPPPSRIAGHPYTSGADIRFQSVDSSLDREIGN